jgi:ferredoxin
MNDQSTSSHWILKTHGNPLISVHQFLAKIWHFAELKGLIIPAITTNDNFPVPTLLTDPDQLPFTNPFSPTVAANAAKMADNLERWKSIPGVGAVLRPCEARMHAVLACRKNTSRGWLLIGTDCLGTFSNQDAPWRLQKAGNVQDLTLQELRFSRQGGISPDRYRPACQDCTPITEPEVDLWIGYIGLPASKSLLITVKNDPWVKRLHIPEITNGMADLKLLTQRRRVIARVSRRRTQSQQRSMLELDPNLPRDARGLINFIAACSPCKACLEICAFLQGELPLSNEAREQWLLACVGCGMCAQACPKQLPLTAMHTLIKNQLLSEILVF